MKRLFCYIILCVLCSPLASHAATITELTYEEDLDQEKSLMIGEVYVIPATNPSRVSVRNPELLDVGKVTEKEVVIVAKKSGDTAVTIWAKDGQKTVYISVYADDLDRIQKRLEKLIYKSLNITGVELKKNETTGKIIIMGEIGPVQKDQIEKVTAPFADKVDILLTVKKESKMVQIEARILELSKNELDNLGIKWNEFIQVRQEPYLAPSGGTTTGVETTLDIVKPMHALWGMGKWSKDAITAKINLLIQTGKGKELSRPKLLCLSGEESKLVVGGEVPYVSGSTTGTAGTSVSVNYKEYGVIFKLRPTVLPDGKIFLSLGAEVSAIDWTNAITLSGIRIPAFTKRTADTVLNLSSGETIFIAGLIKNTETENVDKLPAIAEVPVLGKLFRSKDFRNSQTELVITLTSDVVESQGSAEFPAVTEPKGEQYRNLMAISENSTIPRQLQGYVLRVQKKITDNMAYPTTLLNTGWEGVVMLRLSLDKAGDLRDAQVSKSSGYKIFDDEALRLVRSLSFPSFPSDVNLEELNIEIPIAYRENR